VREITDTRKDCEKEKKGEVRTLVRETNAQQEGKVEHSDKNHKKGRRKVIVTEGNRRSGQLHGREKAAQCQRGGGGVQGTL